MAQTYDALSKLVNRELVLAEKNSKKRPREAGEGPETLAKRAKLDGDASGAKLLVSMATFRHGEIFWYLVLGLLSGRQDRSA